VVDDGARGEIPRAVIVADARHVRRPTVRAQDPAVARRAAARDLSGRVRQSRRGSRACGRRLGCFLMCPCLRLPGALLRRARSPAGAAPTAGGRSRRGAGRACRLPRGLRLPRGVPIRGGCDLHHLGRCWSPWAFLLALLFRSEDGRTRETP